MAKVSAFKKNSRTINTDGEWVPVGDEFDNLEIQTRGFTDAYIDAQTAKQKRAAVGFGGDVDKLPVALRRKINIECLKQHVLLDPACRNLEHDDGVAVTHQQFLEMLSDPDYSDLVAACFRAASMVGQRRKADLDDAAGN